MVINTSKRSIKSQENEELEWNREKRKRKAQVQDRHKNHS